MKLALIPLILFAVACQTTTYTNNPKYAEVTFDRQPEGSKGRPVNVAKWEHFFFFGNVSAPELRDIAKTVEPMLEAEETCYNLQIKNEVTPGQAFIRILLNVATYGLVQAIWEFRTTEISCTAVKKLAAAPPPAAPASPEPSPSPSPAVTP